MRQPAQIYNRGEGDPVEELPPQAKRRPRPGWPFLYTYEDGTVYINRIKRRSTYEQACEVGEADM